MWEVNLAVELEELILNSLCLGEGSSNSCPWFYLLLTGDFCLFNHFFFFLMGIFVTRSPLCFKCKGMLLPTFALRLRSSAAIMLLDRTQEARWFTLEKKTPFIWISWVDKSKTRHCSSPSCDLVWAHSLFFICCSVVDVKYKCFSFY